MNIKSLLKRKKDKVHSNKRKGVFDENKIWKIILSIFIFINVGVVVFSWYLFLQISGGDIFNIKESTAVSVETIDRKLLSDTVISFEDKVREFEGLKDNKPRVVDPSL